MLGNWMCVKVSDRTTTTESSKEKCDGTADYQNGAEHPLLVAENTMGAVTFCVKLIRFQSGWMRSRRISEPDVGGFGRRSWAGFSPN